MTIAALVRGRTSSYNALVVDTGALRSDGVVQRHDKLYRVFGETYATCIGDASILEILLARTGPGRVRPNLRDRTFVHGMFAELASARRTGILLGTARAFPPAPSCTTLAICNRAEVFFWKVERDEETHALQVATAPTFLDAESMVVLRGVTVVSVEGFLTMTQEAAERTIVDQMAGINAHLEASGAEKLGYEMQRRVSGIILPHKTSEPGVWIDPGVPHVLRDPLERRTTS